MSAQSTAMTAQPTDAPPRMPPSNAGYFHAAYVVASVVYLAYAVLVVRRRARTRAALERATANPALVG